MLMLCEPDPFTSGTTGSLDEVRGVEEFSHDMVAPDTKADHMQLHGADTPTELAKM